jgi:hypothetical protein
LQILISHGLFQSGNPLFSICHPLLRTERNPHLRCKQIHGGCSEQSHGIQGNFPCDVSAPCRDRHPIVPPQKLRELPHAWVTNLLLGQGAQKRVIILYEVSMDAQTPGDPIRRHSGKCTRRRRHSIAGREQ